MKTSHLISVIASRQGTLRAVPTMSYPTESELLKARERYEIFEARYNRLLILHTLVSSLRN